MTTESLVRVEVNHKLLYIPDSLHRLTDDGEDYYIHQSQDVEDGPLYLRKSPHENSISETEDDHHPHHNDENNNNNPTLNSIENSWVIEESIDRMLLHNSIINKALQCAGKDHSSSSSSYGITALWEEESEPESNSSQQDENNNKNNEKKNTILCNDELVASLSAKALVMAAVVMVCVLAARE